MSQSVSSVASSWHDSQSAVAHESKGADQDDLSIESTVLDMDAHGTHILSKSERVKRFGLDCSGPSSDGICFKAGTWKPGGEYVQKLFIRNLSTSVKKLKYNLPTSRFFSLAYPEIIILSPGMSQEVDVIFRPVENDPYDDTIFIRVIGGAGGFHVSVRATIDKLSVISPRGVDLGYCPTYQTTSQTFELHNTGEIDAPFRWEQPKGFVLEPSFGSIAAGEKLDICVSIVPTDASVVVGQAICTVGEGVHAEIDEPILTTKFSAIGKYAYISLSESEVNFGEVLTGTYPESNKKEIVLRNTSVVPAEFSLVRHETDADPVFDLYPTEGVIPPQSEVMVTVRYNALGFGSYSLDRYTFITPGDCRTSVSVSGMCMPAKVSLAREALVTPDTIVVDGSVSFPDGAPGNSLNFRDVEIGRSETRIIQIKNKSASDVYFNICVGTDGIFRVNPLRGVIKAEGAPFNIVVTFTPYHPINYYKRLWVMIGDTSPLFFDNMGSGYIRAKGDIKEQRPAPLRHAHVQAYRNRAVHGMGGLSPDELDDAYRSETADPAIFAQAGMSGTRAMSLTTLSNPLTRSGETTRNSVAIAHEFFVDDTDVTCRDITCSTTDFEFGFIPSRTTSESKTVSISNNTNGKVTLMWQIPRTMNDTGEYEQPAFDVIPATGDINPGQSATFKIVFRPFQADRNFVCELEAYVFFKNQRTFRLVNDTTLTPPWCLSFNLSGHTFSAGQLLASARLTGGNIRGGKLTFPNCFEGEAIYQSIILRNTSNLPSTFRFDLGFGEEGSGDADAFTVRPVRGEVPAESFTVVYVRFTPSKARKYSELLRCVVNGDPSTKLLLEGTSSIPFLACPDVTSDDPTLAPPPSKVYGNDNSSLVQHILDIPGVLAPPHHMPTGPLGSFYMKPTCVGLSSSRKFTLKNQSRLPFRYRILMPPEAEGIFTCTPMTGLLRGNQTTQIVMAFAPRACQKYCFKLRVKIYPIGGRAQRVIDCNQPMGTAPPEVLQSLSLLVVCPSEMGAIQFDPPRISMDVRLVNTTERQELFLDNVSDSDVAYQLTYKESYVKDTGNSSESQVEESAMKSLSQNTTTDSLMCDYPQGTLPARSRTRAPITFQPTRAGLFEFAIFCTVRAVPGDTAMKSNEEIALARVSASERESQMKGIGFSALEGLPLVTHITTRATFPKINIVDVRTADNLLVSDVEHLWRNFSLRALNTDLSKPLTVEECAINGSSSPDLSKLERYRFEFTPDVVGAPQQTVAFLFKNEGHLTTSFHIHLPNEKELELEQWCDEDEPSEELNKIISMIEELKLFTIEPQHGVLEPGQTQIMSITYSHKHLKFGGVHNLPVHVKLDKGKQFFLDLIGRTLPLELQSSKVLTNTVTPNTSPSRAAMRDKPLALTNVKALPPTDIILTACTGQDGRYELSPVPIGLDQSEAPLQRMELINVSGVRAVYEINQRSIDDLNGSNFGQPIIRVSNPSGVIEPRSTVMVEWYFYPLEAKTYEVPIKISYEKSLMSDSLGLPESKGAVPLGLTQASITSGQSQESNTMRLPPPPRSAKPSGGRSRHSRSSSHEVSFTLVAPGYDPRHKILQDNTIIDRPESDQQPPPHIFGASPPSEQLITFPKQLASISSDVLNLHFMPQCSKTSRLVIIRNILKRDAIEYNIAVEKCRLATEGLLSIYPTSGKLEPGEHVLIDFNFSLDVKSINLMDRVEVTMREIVGENVKGRRGAFPLKLGGTKGSGSKTGAEHESVVNRITLNRNLQLETNADYIVDGRSAAMPSTITVDGKVKMGATYSKTQQFLEEGSGKVVNFENSFAGGSLTASGVAGEASLANDSKSGSRGANSQSSKIGGSGLMSRNRNRNEESRKNLHGASNTYIIRIRGFILPYETTYRLFGSMGGTGVIPGLKHQVVRPASDYVSGETNEPASMCDFFVPPNQEFIPFITSATFVGDDGTGPVKSKLANALSKINATKEFEMRDITQTIMQDLFRSTLGAGVTTEYLDEVVKEVAASSVKTEIINDTSIVSTATLQVKGSHNQRTQIEGHAMTGFYFDDIRSALNVTNAPMHPGLIASQEETGLSIEVDDGDDPELVALDADDDISISSYDKVVNKLEKNSDGDKKMQQAFQSPDFSTLAMDILRNTMYNLMQEAAYDEFAIVAEPLKFAILDGK